MINTKKKNRPPKFVNETAINLVGNKVIVTSEFPEDIC